MDRDQRKKRRMDDAAEEAKQGKEGDDDEEEKMEKFFALIRSTRDVRERLLMGNAAGRLTKIQEEEQKKMGLESKPVSGWNPTFQPQDFMDYRHYHRHPESSPPAVNPSATHEAGPSNTEGKKEEDQGDDHKVGGGGDDLDLDLKLSR